MPAMPGPVAVRNHARRYGVLAAVVVGCGGAALSRTGIPLAELLGLFSLIVWLNIMALALGRTFGVWLARDCPLLIEAALSAALGWLGLSLVVVALAAAGWLAPVPAWLFCLGVGSLALFREWDWLCRLYRVFCASWRAPLSPAGAWLRAGVIVFLALAVLCLPTPPLFYDTLTYHIAVQEYYLRAGQFLHMPYNFYAGFPQGIEQLFLLGLLLANETASKWIHFSLGLWGLAALWGLGRYRLGLTAPQAWGAVLLAVSAPALWDQLSMSAVDLPPLLYLALVLYFLLGRTLSRAGIVAAAIMTGAAMTVKYTLWLALPLHCLILFLRRDVAVGKRFSRVLCFALVAGLVVSPWVIKNIVLTGNPVYPFSLGVFPVRDIDAEMQATYRQEGFESFGTEKDLAHLLARPWDVTMHDGRGTFGTNTYPTIGPLFLLLLPFGLLAGFPRKWGFLLYLLAWYVWWSSTSQQVRHMLFFLALLTPVMVHGARRLWRLPVRRILVIVVAAAVLHNLAWGVMKKERFYHCWDYLAGTMNRAEYLHRYMHGSALREAVNRLPATARVLVIGYEYGAYFTRDVTVAPSFNRDPLEKLIYAGVHDAAGLARALREAGYTHVAISDELLAFKQHSRHYRWETLPREARRAYDSFRRDYLVPVAGDATFSLGRIREQQP